MNSGSRWARWDPHIHAPGTLFNDQFKGPTAWADYLTSLEGASPAIQAIGVTDYYCTDTYQAVLKEKKEKGRLPGVRLVFPNVELRLDVATVKERWTNIHLLVSPDDPAYLFEIDRFLSRLRFEAFGDNFACTRDDLMQLGRRSKPQTKDDRTAFREGAAQFKVNFAQLREEFEKSDWAKRNVLVAIATGTDGTSSIRGSSDAILRQEIEKFADIIFAGSPAQRDFWLGRKEGATPEQLQERYGGCKPCLHGSDAHAQEAVGNPAGKRYSWIKGALAFDTLFQAVIDPAGRAFVGERPPFRATPAHVISSVELVGAEWAETPRLALNPGLVAIIGARGSGKTALADAIAAGCDATDGRLSKASFLVRAREHLGGVGVRLGWEIGDSSERPLLTKDADPSRYPRARYLSQKFVEELSSSDGLKDELLEEIQRVIFEAHGQLERDGATNFEGLLELRTAVLRDNRTRDEEAIAVLSDQVAIERDKVARIPSLRAEIRQKEALVGNYIRSRDSIVTAGSKERIARLTELTQAADHARTQIRFWSQENVALRSLRGDVSDFRTTRAPMALRLAKEKFAGAHLKEPEWAHFEQRYAGDVDQTLSARLAAAEKAAAEWRGTVPPRKANDQEPYVPDGETLKGLSLSLLEAEISRIQRLIDVDAETGKRLTAVTTRIGEESAALAKLKETLSDCNGAAARAKQLQADREDAYLRIFESIVAEEQVLHVLYKPLMERLAKATGTLRKLSFSVSRHADVRRWATEGELLFDKRRTGPFKGVGTLEGWAEASLKRSWESGDPAAVAAAMAQFREQHQTELLNLSDIPKAQQVDYRSWLRRFAKWLYGTDHIKISYSIDYEGTDIRKLSPGTRGIVLLLLYLALDDSDDRPLIIDQPEENLDPKSIFDELVELFVSAKDTRQVIMVTHNANLVVNTDADQVIVAAAGVHAPGRLPPIQYLSGGPRNRRHAHQGV